MEERDYSYYLFDDKPFQRLHNTEGAFEYQDKVDDAVQIHQQHSGALEDLSDIQEWEYQYTDSFP